MNINVCGRYERDRQFEGNVFQTRYNKKWKTPTIKLAHSIFCLVIRRFGSMILKIKLLYSNFVENANKMKKPGVVVSIFCVYDVFSIFFDWIYRL